MRRPGAAERQQRERVRVLALLGEMAREPGRHAGGGDAQRRVGDLLRLAPGAVLELDRKVGEAIDVFVNNRLVARGEVVLVEDRLGVTMTEIVKGE